MKKKKHTIHSQDDNLKGVQHAHKMKSKKVDGMLNENKTKSFAVGDMVLGLFEKCGWWFGRIANNEYYKLTKGHCWFHSFGDNKTYMVKRENLRLHTMFAKAFSPAKMKKSLYKKAVLEFLMEVAEKEKRVVDKKQRSYIASLVTWACTGFQKQAVDFTVENREENKQVISVATLCKKTTETKARINKRVTTTNKDNILTAINKQYIDETNNEKATENKSAKTEKEIIEQLADFSSITCKKAKVAAKNKVETPPNHVDGNNNELTIQNNVDKTNFEESAKSLLTSSPKDTSLSSSSSSESLCVSSSTEHFTTPNSSNHLADSNGGKENGRKSRKVLRHKYLRSTRKRSFLQSIEDNNVETSSIAIKNKKASKNNASRKTLTSIKTADSRACKKGAKNNTGVNNNSTSNKNENNNNKTTNYDGNENTSNIIRRRNIKTTTNVAHNNSNTTNAVTNNIKVTTPQSDTSDTDSYRSATSEFAGSHIQTNEKQQKKNNKKNSRLESSTKAQEVAFKNIPRHEKAGQKQDKAAVRNAQLTRIQEKSTVKNEQWQEESSQKQDYFKSFFSEALPAEGEGDVNLEYLAEKPIKKKNYHQQNKMSNEQTFNDKTHAGKETKTSAEVATRTREELSMSAPKSRLKRFGIELDADLIGSRLPKRKCVAKDDEKSTTAATVSKQPKYYKPKRGQSKDKPFPVEQLNLSQRATRPVEKKKIKLTKGDLVIGKLQGYDWWFGEIKSLGESHYWVRWYGDNKISQLHADSLEHLENFHVRFLPTKLRGLYLRSVRECLDEAARRVQKHDLSPEPDERLTELIHWAMDGFPPKGARKLTQRESDSSEIDDSREEVAETIDSLSQPQLSREVKALFDRVARGVADINKICLGCGDTNVIDLHPLFEGAMCAECKDSIMETAFLYDEDGTQMYCTICGDGRQIILCDTPGCSRSYCSVCLDMFCGVGYSSRMSNREFACVICTGEGVRILRRRDDWKERLKQMFSLTNEEEHVYPSPVYFEPIPYEMRKPLRVLSLFDGISTGLFALKQLGLEVQLYIASEIESDAIKVSEVRHYACVQHVGDVRNIQRSHIAEWGPFDLVIGGSPCNDLSMANPLRKGIYEGTGRLFFEFYRILEYCRPHDTSRPFFWLFENVVGMDHEDREVISRFLQCNPVMVSAKEVSAQHRARYFWGNIPGMRRVLCPRPTDALTLQQCLEPNCGRTAKVEKVRCITTNQNSLKQDNQGVVLPVRWRDREDGLWLTEIERIFGFPGHYTDIGNMGQKQRQKLLGKSWSVPVVRHLLAPLRQYFKGRSSDELLNDDDMVDVEFVANSGRDSVELHREDDDDRLSPVEEKLLEGSIHNESIEILIDDENPINDHRNGNPINDHRNHENQMNDHRDGLPINDRDEGNLTNDNCRVVLNDVSLTDATDHQAA